MRKKVVRWLRLDSVWGVVIFPWRFSQEWGDNSHSVCVDPKEPDRRCRLEMSVGVAANLAARLSECVAKADGVEQRLKAVI